MKIRKLLPITIFVAAAFSAIAGQTNFSEGNVRSVCNNDVRSTVWQQMVGRDWFSSEWDCNKIELRQFRFKNEKAFVVNSPGMGCGATGNCPTWVVLNSKGRQRIILDLGSQDYKMYEIKYHKGSHVPELWFRHRMGSADFYESRFTYYKGRYQLTECSYEYWDIDRTYHTHRANRKYCNLPIETSQTY